MKLIIAEKPSLARSVAKVIGVVKEHKDKGFIECNDGYNVTWVFGHIIELVKPEVYNPEFKRFNLNNLPIIPDNWQYQAKTSAKSQYNNIKDLLKSATIVVNCGDPDREGQLLVDELLIHLKNKKPVKRLLILDPKDDGIRKALNNMEDNSKYQSWYQAGLLRTQADWLLGFNFTPAFTKLGNLLGIEGIISMGRVQTPTLKLIYDREMAIRNYKPLKYYNLVATFLTTNNETFSAKLDLASCANIVVDSEGRLLDKNALNQIQSTIKNQTAKIIAYEVKDCETSQPLAFKLSDLQAVVNAKLGLSADEVLQVAQTLYEKQLTTYPRTACNYLPESLHTDASNNLSKLAKHYPIAENADVKIKSRSFDDKKLDGESHFGIIPTGDTAALTSLKPHEIQVYDMIVTQYIAQFYPAMKYQQTTGVVECRGYKFKFSGKVTKNLGWKQLFINNQAEDEDVDNNDENQVLPPLAINQDVKHSADEIQESNTTKPKPYSEGLLIKAMANIHTQLEDIVKTYYSDDVQAKQIIGRYKSVLKDSAGLGTEATRANIINTLKERDYIVVKKKNLEITDKGIAVMQLLTTGDRLTQFSMLSNPLTTAMYEQQLDDILKMTLQPEQFNKNLHQLIHDKIGLVKQIYNTVTPAQQQQRKLTGNKCPQCNSDMEMKKGKFGDFEACSNYPNCKYIVKKVQAYKPKAEVSNEKCDKCGKAMVTKKSRDGKKEFLACSGYPDCKNIK